MVGQYRIRTLRQGMSVLLLGAVVALLAVAGSAAARRSGPCDARAGSTLAEDSAVRVFRSHGADYACLRPSGYAYRLRDYPPTYRGVVTDLQLAGRFVAWIYRYNDSADLVVLDVQRGNTRPVSGAGPHEGFAAYGVTAGGTVVVLDETFNPFAGPSAQYASTVYESTPTVGTTLDSATSTSGYPIQSLALTQAGDFAYWRDNGAIRGSAINPS